MAGNEEIFGAFSKCRQKLPSYEETAFTFTKIINSYSMS